MVEIVAKTGAFRELTVEKVPANSNDVTNKTYVDSVAGADLTAITSHVIANVDDTYNLGSAAKRWANLYAVIATLTLLVIGGIYFAYESSNNRLYLNGSIYVNGSIIADKNITGLWLYGNASQLYSLNASKIKRAVNNTEIFTWGKINVSNITYGGAATGASIGWNGTTLIIKVN